MENVTYEKVSDTEIKEIKVITQETVINLSTLKNNLVIETEQREEMRLDFDRQLAEKDERISSIRDKIDRAGKLGVIPS